MFISLGLLKIRGKKTITDVSVAAITAGVIVLFSLFFFLGIFPSAIWSHLVFVAPPSLLVVALLLDRLA